MPYYRCPACGSMSHSVAAYSTAGVCAVCSAELPEHAKLQTLNGSPFGVSRNMRAGLGAPGQARRTVTGLPVGESARENLALLVSELVTNSIRHAGLGAGDPIELQVTSDNGRLWVSVHDSGPGFSRQTNGAALNGGLGLAIVTALTEQWGVDHGPDGCTVWCAMEASA